MLEAALRKQIDAALRAAGAGPLVDATQLGGGSFGATWRLAARGGRFFLKLGAASHPFDAEVEALREIAATRTLRVPQPVACGVVGREAFLLLEWVDLRGDGDWGEAGAQLAALNAVNAPRYGWSRDNTIGASVQLNTPCATWAEFWRERRLRPQFRLARANGLGRLAALEARACAASDALLAGHAPAAALLHGDLWRGNVAFDPSGRPVVFDPSTYHGDAETDLAMARLFGGFPSAFYAAYAAVRPPSEGVAARLGLYQLYHVLNHANLFGDGYVTQAHSLIDTLGAR